MDQNIAGMGSENRTVSTLFGDPIPLRQIKRKHIQSSIDSQPFANKSPAT